MIVSARNGGTRAFTSTEYKAWKSEAFKRCLTKNAETRFVSVSMDAGYACYSGPLCTPSNQTNMQTWVKAFQASVYRFSRFQGNFTVDAET